MVKELMIYLEIPRADKVPVSVVMVMAAMEAESAAGMAMLVAMLYLM